MLSDGVKHCFTQGSEHLHVNIEHGRLRSERISEVRHKAERIAHRRDELLSFCGNRIHVQFAEQCLALAYIQGARQKRSDNVYDLVKVRFERVVAPINETDLCIRQVAKEGFCTLRQKEGIVLAPNRKEGRLVRAEIVLELRKACDVILVVPPSRSS